MSEYQPILSPDTLRGMKTSRKADREHIAREIRTIADKLGATVEERQEPRNPGFRGAGIHFGISLDGVGVMLNINDIHGGSYALLHWYGTEHRARLFSHSFACAAKVGSGHHKATTHPRDWYALALCLHDGLVMAARGTAFTPSPE